MRCCVLPVVNAPSQVNPIGPSHCPCAVILTLLRDAENDDMNCVLGKLLELYPAEMVPYAVELVTELVRACPSWMRTARKCICVYRSGT